MDTPKSVKDFLAKIGSKGGKAKSKPKADAGRLNAEKARLALAEKRAKAKPEDADKPDHGYPAGSIGAFICEATAEELDHVLKHLPPPEDSQTGEHA